VNKYVSEFIPDGGLELVSSHGVAGQDDQTLLHSVLVHFHAVLELVDLDAVAKQQGKVAAIGRVEFHLQELIGVFPQVNEALTSTYYCLFLHVDHQHAKGRRSAGNGQVLSVEGEFEGQDLERADVADLEVAGGIVEVEVEVGVLAVVGEDGDASLMQGGEGLVGAPFGVAG
jgi:hypothetical protein